MITKKLFLKSLIWQVIGISWISLLSYFWFGNFMRSIGKLGGQNKVPRISNDRKIIDKIIKLNNL